MGVPSHSIDGCMQFKVKVQKLKDASLLIFLSTKVQPNVQINPLSEHKK